MAEDGVERFHHADARWGDLGELLRDGTAISDDQPGGVGIEGIGDVD
jgi:hypothetical protein